MISKLKQFIKNTRKAKENLPEGYVTSTGDVFYINEVVIVPTGTSMIRCFDGYYAPVEHKEIKAYIHQFSDDGYFFVEPLWTGMKYKVHSSYIVKLNGERNYNKKLMEFLLS